MRYDSPLRYPGGKASLATLLARTIELNDLSGCAYYEPYAGGAGAALRLLREGVVSELYLNDLDVRIASFWNAALNEPERFVEAILSVPLSIEEWKKQQRICRQCDTRRRFELGFATFYLNRCNRSGVLLRAAPIGGHVQKGRWRIDARFNRSELAERIIAIARKRQRIHLTNMDALEFLVRHLPRGQARKHIFAYLDPPYYSNGDRLYLNHYQVRDHRKLARYMQRQKTLKWVMSYDDVAEIQSMYTSCAVGFVSIRYSLQRRQQTRELVIAPCHVKLPASVAYADVDKYVAASA